jgi:hypothetical protein
MIKTILIASVAPATFLAAAAYLSALPLEARPLSSSCSHHAWPYYQSTCVRDPRQSVGFAREVRIVSTDRLSIDNSIR